MLLGRVGWGGGKEGGWVESNPRIVAGCSSGKSHRVSPHAAIFSDLIVSSVKLKEKKALGRG